MSTDPPPPLEDMQALFVTAFTDLPHGKYLLLAVHNIAAARHWLERVLQAGLVANAREVQPPVTQRRQEVLSVALSHAGLLALQGVPSTPFPSVFSDGMGQPQRAQGLGDADAATWRWSDTPASQRPVVHLLVAHYWSATAGAHAAGAVLCADASLKPAFTVVARVHGNPGFFVAKGHPVEPFGFRDGLSQPEAIGLNERSERSFRDADAPRQAALARNRVAAGEFVLGLRNEYAETAYAPDLKDWPGAEPFAHGATYLAVRQIVQDVAAWQAFEQAHPAAPGEPSVAEKMVGRRKADGRALCLEAPPDSEDFGYAVTDPQGFGCPRGAHMRRANPRDTLGQTPEQGEANAKLHRLLRRGRSYCCVDDRGAETGMMFIALNADIDRQFALIQQRWIAGSRFADLAHETDPLMGQTHRAFTIPDPVLGQRLINLPRFTRIVGAGYFLLPTLGGLAFLAQPIPAAAPTPPAATAPAQRS